MRAPLVRASCASKHMCCAVRLAMARSAALACVVPASAHRAGACAWPSALQARAERQAPAAQSRLHNRAPPAPPVQPPPQKKQQTHVHASAMAICSRCQPPPPPSAAWPVAQPTRQSGRQLLALLLLGPGTGPGGLLDLGRERGAERLADELGLLARVHLAKASGCGGRGWPPGVDHPAHMHTAAGRQRGGVCVCVLERDLGTAMHQSLP